MTTPFSLTRDINGYNGFGLAFSDTNNQVTLAASVEQHFTIPSDAPYYLIIFGIEPGAAIWVANNATATLPSGSIAGTLSQLNPSARFVKGGDVISMITPDTTAEVGVSIYAL